jgi:RNA polymerase sigma factor (sigma-70 family)
VAAPVVSLLDQLRRLSPTGPDSDAARLDRFARHGDQHAFAALVDEHGPMVLRVCRRVLGDAQAAEDAAQATFLVLARRAHAIGRGDALAGWLHGVARRVALKARAGLARRGQPLVAANTPADNHADPLVEVSVRELLSIIDEEVDRLPRDYRLPVLLCCLEGLSQQEAARRLGWMPGSLKGRLERGRKRLHARLARRGIVAAAACAALELCRAASVAAIPAKLVSATVKGAVAFTARQGAMDAASTEAARLATAMLPGAAVGTTRLVLVSLLVLALTAVGATALTRLSPAEPLTPSQPISRPGQLPIDAKGHVDREGVALPPEAIARIGSARLRHGGQVTTAAYTPDGKSIASLDEDGHLCFWDAATGQVQRRLRPSNSAYEGRLVVRPDGKSVVIFDGHSCRTVDVATGKELRSFAQESEGFALYPSFDRAGTVLAIHTANVLRVIDVNSGKERFRLPVDGELIHDAAVSADGKTVATSIANGGTIALFDTSTGKVTRELKGPEGSAGILAFAADGKLLLSCARLPVVWDLTTYKIAGQIKDFYNPRCAAISPDGKLLAVGGYDGGRFDGVLIAEAPSAKVLRRLPAPDPTSVAFTADGRTVLVGGRNGEISQWNLETGRLLDASASPFPGVKQLRFLDDRRLLLRAQTFEVWDWRAGKVVERFADMDAGRHGSPDVSADGRWLAYPVDKGEILLIDGHQIEKPRRLPGHKQECLTVRFAPDGRTLFSSGTDKLVCGWDMATCQLRHEWKDHTQAAMVLEVSPDGRWVVSATTWLSTKRDAVIRVWDVKANRLALKLAQPNRYFTTFAFSPDGRRLAAGGGEGEFDVNSPGHIVVFDLPSGEPIADIAGHPRPVNIMAFSPDGRCVVAANWHGEKKDALFRYWELATGQERYRFNGHAGYVRALTFSPTGALLAVASPEAPAYVWDVYGKSLAKQPFAGNMEEKQRLWQDLGSRDAKVSFQAVRKLIADADTAVALLAERLKPAPPVDSNRVQQWLEDLGSDDFDARQAATIALENLGDRIETMLRDVVTSGLALEAKRRVQSLIDKFDAPIPDLLARSRALEALEQIATPAAVRLLETMAAGQSDARLTRQAAAALGRTRKRAAPPER